jgi:hypothetical protein
MDVAVGIKLVEMLIANLPAIIDTAPKLLAWINNGYAALLDAWDSDKPSTPQEIDALIDRIVAKQAAIDAID